AEPCAVLPAGSPLGGLLELLENALGRFGLEAGARVIHLEGERGAIALPGPCHGNEYAALIGELDSVAEEVEQNLAQPPRIGGDRFRHIGRDMAAKPDPLGEGARS